VEQNAKMALAVSHRGYVLEMGKKRLEGEAENLLANEAVKSFILADSINCCNFSSLSFPNEHLLFMHFHNRFSGNNYKGLYVNIL
jgi:hypothetical protein